MSASRLAYVPTQPLDFPDFAHAISAVPAALHGSLHTVALELGFEIIQAQLHMPHTLSLYA